MPEDKVKKRVDGKLEQRFDSKWIAEYYEDPDTGLWRVDIFQHDAPQWSSQYFESLDEAQKAAIDYIDQSY